MTEKKKSLDLPENRMVFGWRLDGHDHYVTIPKDMILWQGDKGPPDDWDGELVLNRRGQFVSTTKAFFWCSDRPGLSSYILAYRPLPKEQ